MDSPPPSHRSPARRRSGNLREKQRETAGERGPEHGRSETRGSGGSARLPFELRVHLLPLDLQHRLAVPAGLHLRRAQQRHRPPALPLGEARVHLQEVRAPQPGLVAAGARADLRAWRGREGTPRHIRAPGGGRAAENTRTHRKCIDAQRHGAAGGPSRLEHDVLVVERVRRQQEHRELRLELVRPGREARQLLLGHLRHLRVLLHERPRVRHLLLHVFELLVGVDHVGELRELHGNLLVLLRVAGHLFCGELWGGVGRAGGVRGGVWAEGGRRRERMSDWVRVRGWGATSGSAARMESSLWVRSAV